MLNLMLKKQNITSNIRVRQEISILDVKFEIPNLLPLINIGYVIYLKKKKKNSSLKKLGSP